mmetsp:Transcript_12994/g.32428  ORF Transcript_12994/g.32428 Transcript_12994/m.32428 type:complete len:503 (-) Transcript_12994:308-1816(-)
MLAEEQQATAVVAVEPVRGHCGEMNAERQDQRAVARAAETQATRVQPHLAAHQGEPRRAEEERGVRQRRRAHHLQHVMLAGTQPVDHPERRRADAVRLERPLHAPCLGLLSLRPRPRAQARHGRGEDHGPAPPVEHEGVFKAQRPFDGVGLPDTGQPHQCEADTVHLPVQRRLRRSRRRRVDTAAGRERGVERRAAQRVPKAHTSVRSDVVAGGEQTRLFGRGNATLEDRGGLVLGQRVRGTGRDGGHHVRRRRDELTIEPHGALHARGAVDLGDLVLHQRLEHVAIGEDAVLPVVAHSAVGQEEGARGRQPAAVGQPSNHVAAGAAVRSARAHRQLLAAGLLEAQLGARSEPHAAGQVLCRRRAARGRRLEQRVGTAQRRVQPLLGQLSHLVRRLHAVHELDEAGEPGRHAKSPRSHAALAVQCVLADRAEQHVQRGRGLLRGARSGPLHRRVAKARRAEQRPARRRLGERRQTCEQARRLLTRAVQHAPSGLQLEVEDCV